MFEAGDFMSDVNKQVIEDWMQVRLTNVCESYGVTWDIYSQGDRRMFSCRMKDKDGIEVSRFKSEEKSIAIFYAITGLVDHMARKSIAGNNLEKGTKK